MTRSDRDTEAARLERFLQDLGRPLPAERIVLLQRYMDELLRWNARVNLVSCRSREAFLARHLCDALSVLPHLPDGVVADAGSGAGLPGLPLAIACPGQTFRLVDSNAKKTAFLYAVVTGLGLGNVMIHNSRLSAVTVEGGVDALVSRAFGPLPGLLRDGMHLVRPGGHLLLMKGRQYERDLPAIRPPLELVAVHDLALEGRTGHSMLLELLRTERQS